MKLLCYLVAMFGNFMGACALMTWGFGYTCLAVVIFFINLYCISCAFDEDK